MHQTGHPYRARITAIPDLRFEPSYLRSIQPYVRKRGSDDEPGQKGKNVDPDDEMSAGKAKSKGKQRESLAKTQLEVSVSSPASSEFLHIQWGGVVWVTLRDQIINPLLQGALWLVDCLIPLFSLPLAAIILILSPGASQATF
jgi:hypothetical protein